MSISWHPGSSSVLHLPSSASISKVCLPLATWMCDTIHNTIVLLLSSSRVFPVPIISVCTESWDSRPPEPPSAFVTPVRVCGRSGFRERRRDCSLIWSFFLVVLLIGLSSSSSSWWTFEGLHREHLLAPTEVRYFEQHTMSTRVNGATVPWAWVPPLGILIFTVSKFSKVLCS
jgi:hypothetical protein